jgi:hypothetical protein
MTRTNKEIQFAGQALVFAPNRVDEVQRRAFNAIKDACKDFLEFFQDDKPGELARGVYTAVPESNPTATLSYNRIKETVSLKIPLRTGRPLTEDQFAVLLRLQATTILARFAPGDRRNSLFLEAASSCPDPHNSQGILLSLSECLRQILQDDRLKVLIETK